MMRPLLIAIAACACLVCVPLRAANSTYETIDDLGFSQQDAAGEKLVGYLDSEDSQQRWRAARALGNLGYKPAVDQLAGLLGDDDPVVQVHAMIALTRIGDVSPGVVEAIMEKVASSDERVARTALQTLKRLKPGPEKLAAALEKVLESDDQAVMSHALDALIEAGGAATPLLERALENEKSAYWAALAIEQIGPDCAGACNGLTKVLLRSQDDATLQQALLALAALGESAHQAAPAVQKVAAETKSDAVRIAACYALGNLGDSSATDLLRRLASQGGEFQQLVATWSIAKLHPDDPAAEKQAVGLLTKALASDRPEVREAAATGLSKLDAPVEVVAPALLSALESADAAQQSNIAAALASLGPKALDRAIAALDKPQFTDIAIEVLGRMGPDAEPAAEALAAKLEGASNEQRTRVQFALGAIGPGAESAAAQIAAGLASDDPAVRQSALFALRQTGGGADARDQVAAFMKSSSDDFEKLAAAWTLARLEPSGEQLATLASVLKEGLGNSEPQARIETIDAIASLGPAALPLKAAVEKAAESDSNSDVREAAEGVAAGL
ncbi:HEAT repeat protein [Posidoniimonas polymericola]|uniref:HEAT repeat protein n=1 Tax=Posidoniimonas polymericola TaxID=2528002 RepID=A0A5C5YTL3_9BACT|nr:HEAT repeat domain-containing protein [Posidoniimonas polymericola]TWT78096.1 HEAT repeat protein [Posidoniimonas polymericola]